MSRRARKDTIVIVGLGRFGTALAEELHSLGYEVMGIDGDEARVRACQGALTFAEVGDTTDSEMLRGLGVQNVDHAVVAIGDAVQSSILAAATLVDLAIPDVWAKALTEQHRSILERVGVHHTVFPERDMGVRVAHRIDGRILDYLELADGFVIAEMNVPAAYVGRTVNDCRLREAYGVSVVCHKPGGGVFAITTGDTVLGADDEVLVAGTAEDVERFAADS